MRNKSAFTLVELIVVITILSILGTIAFISLQGFSRDARNSKVNSDLRSLASIVEVAQAGGSIIVSDIIDTPYLDYSVDNNVNTFGSGIILDDTLDTGNYHVGSIDFAVLKQNKDDFFFQGAGNVEYEYLGAYAAQGEASYYQILGYVETAGNTHESVIKGNYLDLGGINDVEGLITESSGGRGIKSGESITSDPINPTRSQGSETPIIGGPVEGPAGASLPFNTWTATLGDVNISLPDSDSYNNFTANLAVNNTNIIIEIGNQNATIDTRYANDSITTGYGNSDINIAGGDNTITVGNGYNDIYMGSNGNNDVTIGNGDNYIENDGGNITVTGGNGDNEFLLGYGNIININLGDGNNTINGTNGGNFQITLGNGDNTISPGAFGNHNITLGNGSNTLTGVGGSSIVTTGTSGSANVTFGGNQAQQLIWRGGNINLSDFWRWGNNRISFENISDINNCTEVNNNLVTIGSDATITSIQGTLVIGIQDGQTELNCNTTMIF